MQDAPRCIQHGGDGIGGIRFLRLKMACSRTLYTSFVGKQRLRTDILSGMGYVANAAGHLRAEATQSERGLPSWFL
jgi:hypothetical protein